MFEETEASHLPRFQWRSQHVPPAVLDGKLHNVASTDGPMLGQLLGPWGDNVYIDHH